MIKHKNSYNANQFMSKTNHDQPIKKNDTKLTYDEIRKIVEHTDEKEIQGKASNPQIKNKFSIV